jgi:hypothetical protein
MTYSNPYLPMRWLNLRPRLLFEDMQDIVTRLRLIYPELVLFPRALHFPDRKEPRYATMPARFYSGLKDYSDDPWLEGGLSPYGLALRVPWPEDIACGDPERLIGGRERRAYEDDVGTYRRFGRVVYLDCGISQEIVPANRQAIAELLNVNEDDVPAVHWFRHCLSQNSVEFLYNSADPEMKTFERNVRQCMRGLTTGTSAAYDIMTGEPMYSFPTRLKSLRWLRQCALGDNLYLGPVAFFSGRVLFSGPSPGLLKKWREEAGLPYGKVTNPADVKMLDHQALRQRHHAGQSKRLPRSIDPDNWSE